MNCKLCNKKLVPIGNLRKNGKCHSDWKTRQYHKKCWVKIQLLNSYEIQKKYIC